MGFGTYSHDAHVELLKGRTDTPAQAIFQQKQCHPLMNPKGVRVRQSRDSADHPRSLGIAFALDVTGSMGEYPRILATKELPRFMKILLDCGVQDPQVMFMAVGDATSDQAPLQVGQFESTAELMDLWLTRSYLEGRGGPGITESYELALYFLAQHTEMDCVVKRKHKGYLFLTGDELPYSTVSRHVVESVIGDQLDDDLSIEAVVALLQESYHPFFLLPADPARIQRCERQWRDLLGDNVLRVPKPDDTCFIAAGALVIKEGILRTESDVVSALRGAGLAARDVEGVMASLRPLLG